MKIAVASDDQKHVAGHFGRTKGFVITEMNGESVGSREYRLNTFSHHGKGQTDGGQKGGHHHSHSGILKGLADCTVVISRGMGRRMYDDLRAAGIEAFITSEVEVDKATEAYLTGALEDHPEKGCSH